MSPPQPRLTPPPATRPTRRTATPTRTPTPTKTSLLRSSLTTRQSTPTRSPTATRQPTPTRHGKKKPTTPRTPTPNKQKKRPSTPKERRSSIPRVRVNTSTTIASTKTAASSVTSVTSPSSSTWSSVPTTEQQNVRRREAFRKPGEGRLSQNKDELMLRKTDSIEEGEREDEATPPKRHPTPTSSLRSSSAPSKNSKLTISTTCTPSISLPKPAPSNRRTSEPLFRTLDLLEQKWKHQKITSPLPPCPHDTQNKSAPPTTIPSTEKSHLSSLALAAARGRRRSTSENQNNARAATTTAHYEILEQKWRKQKIDSPLMQRSASQPLSPTRAPKERKKKTRSSTKSKSKKTVPVESNASAPPVKVIKARPKTPPRPSRTPRRLSSSHNPQPSKSSGGVSLRQSSAPPRTLQTHPSSEEDDNSSVSTLSYDSAEDIPSPTSRQKSNASVFDRLYSNAPRSLSQKRATSNASVGLKSLGMESKGNVSKGVNSLDRRSFGKYFNSKRESKIPSFTGRR